MRRALAVAVAVAVAALLPRAARASGGIQVDEQSAPGVGMAGAQTAVANDPAAIFYNAGGLAFQPGFGSLVGGNLIVTRTQVDPDHLVLWHPTVYPTVFVGQRFGDHVAIGIGGFANFGEHFGYPDEWRGRFQATYVDITTYTLQPTLAIRPFSWLGIGVGLDVLFGAIDLYRALQFGGAEGSLHAGGDAIGIGGNVGAMIKLVPRHLQLGFSYRSRVDMSFDGRGALTVPPELQSMVPAGLQRAQVGLPLPHNFAIGLAGFFGHLIVSAEVKASLWSDVQTLVLTLSPLSPQTSAAMTPPAIPATTVNVDLHNSWAIRAGAQYGFFGDWLRVRIGAGYDSTPLPTSTLGPLLPDSQRVLVSTGVGVHWKRVSLDVGYMAVFLIKATSTNPDLIATYQTFGQVISASATLQLERLLQHHRAFDGDD